MTVAHSLVRKHPLQRLPSPSRGFSALVHVRVLIFVDVISRLMIPQLLGLSSFIWSFK